jgi:hypothetical protein|tara:strand:- start:2551 stop:2958 length:408 start_codon:yes stop_codon:yes gene_type:complete
MCVLFQLRNLKRYRVARARKHNEAATYLESDVCSDPITRGQLGTFHLCEQAEQIVNEAPTVSALYDLLDDWYPCGHGRCDAVRDWVHTNLYILLIAVGLLGYLVYIKYMDYRKMELFAHMTLPRNLALASAQHVD